MINVGKKYLHFFVLINEQNYDKSIDNKKFLEYILNMLATKICSL